MVKYTKKMAILAILVVAYGVSAMQQVARKSPSLASSALVAARSSAQTARPALARAGLIRTGVNTSLESPALARYRSTLSMPKGQVQPQAFNKAMKEQPFKGLEPYIIGAGAVAGGAGTYAGLSVYDDYKAAQERYKKIPKEIVFPKALDAGHVYTLKDLNNTDIRPSRNVAYHNLNLLKNGTRYMESAYLRNITINGVSVYSSDLSGADLSKSTIKNSSFNVIEANNSNFSETKISASSFSGHMNKAIFSNSQLGGVEFSFARMKEAQFNDVIVTGYVSFRGVHLENANFSNISTQFEDVGIKYRGIVHFEEAKLANANFKNADLASDRFDTRADFTNADLRNAQFEGANLKGARFSGSNLQGATFNNADLKDVSFDNADLSGADFNQTDISGVRFAGAKLKGTKLDTSKLSYVDYASYKWQNGITA